jgi:hypothetical protein
MGSIKIIAVSAVLAAGVIPNGVADAHPNDVQVARGGQPASIVETREAGVRVYRGPAAARPAALPGKAVGGGAIVQIVSAGSRVWIVDPAAGRLSVCRLVATTQIGENKIDCLTRPL